jgi:hypothetical protein
MKVEDLSFRNVCEFVKKDHKDLIPDVDVLLSVVLISTVIFTGNPLLALPETLKLLADAFGVKSELSKIAERIFEKITEKKDNDPLARMQRMEIAYCLIYNIPQKLDRQIRENEAVSRKVRGGKDVCSQKTLQCRRKDQGSHRGHQRAENAH